MSVVCIFFFFFFSSRRRHTRLQGDWSSDVCSSDLICTKTIHESLCYENTFLCGFRYEINDLARTGFCHNTVIISFSFIHFPGGTIMHLDLSVKFLTIRQIIMFRWIADI